jgi:hypothetical protein
MRAQIRNVNTAISHSTIFITYSTDISNHSRITIIKLDNRSQGWKVRCASNHIIVCVAGCRRCGRRARRRTFVLQVPANNTDAMPCERIQRWNEFSQW